MIVFVVGLYKSGTSFVTQMIEEMGVPSVVEDFRKNTSVTGVKMVYTINESYEVNMLNNDIIRFSGQDEMHFKTDELVDDLSDELKNRIRNVYERIGYTGVIKDPRFIGTLKYWLREIPASVAYKIVWVTRNSVDIEASFKKDNWFINKITGNDTYSGVIENLQRNFTLGYELNSKVGMLVEYEFINKYKTEAYKLIFNYITSTDDTNVNPVPIYFSSYFKDAAGMKQLFSTQAPFNIPVWKNIVAVDSEDEAQYVVVQDKTTDAIKDVNKVIFFGREPKHVPGGYRFMEDAGQAYHHELGTSWLPQTWWVNIPFNELTELNPTKTRPLSIIDSGKNLTQYHSTRLQIINAVRSKIDMESDIFGGINGNTLPERNKADGLLPYMYNLSIENGRTPLYFSEKFVDPILCLTMPIYLGCTEINKYFPNGSYILIDDSKPIDYIADYILDISKSNYRNEHINELQEARNLILTKYNIWNTIYLAVTNHKIL